MQNDDFQKIQKKLFYFYVKIAIINMLKSVKF